MTAWAVMLQRGRTIHVTNHARERMAVRFITMGDIRRVVQLGASTPGYPRRKDRGPRRDVLTLDGIVCVVTFDGAAIVLVTVYRESEPADDG